MVLVLDNYDSFTWNLVQILGGLGADPRVIRNDEASVEEVRALRPDRIVISPGPCTPAQAGISIALVRELAGKVPMLGVCLGHQAIAEAFGGRTVRAEKVMHGKVDTVRHSGSGIFAGLPDPLNVTRYHSLVTEPSSFPDVLEVVAWSASPTGGREIQGLRHRTDAVWGVQFHPESLFSEGGHRLLESFLAL